MQLQSHRLAGLILVGRRRLRPQLFSVHQRRLQPCLYTQCLLLLLRGEFFDQSLILRYKSFSLTVSDLLSYSIHNPYFVLQGFCTIELGLDPS